MSFAELAARIQSAVGIDVAGVFEVFQSEHGTSDLTRFLGYLHEEGIVDAALFAELAAAGAIEATGLPEATTLARDAGPSATRANEARYERVGKLGEGAMGDVFVARDASLRRRVALKTLKPALARKLVDRFVKEVQITAQLDHPGVVPVYGLEVAADGEVAYAMKLVQGKELARIVQGARERLDAGQAPEHGREARIELLLRVCEAVAFAHDRGVLHRDLKPANVMVGRFGEIYVMDWGIARLRSASDDATVIELEAEDGPGERTRVGAILGTPLYMSPEQAAGDNDALDGRSDLYALGLILQELVTLRRARDGKALQEVLDAAKKSQRVAPEPYAGEGPIPRELAAIVEHATRADRDERYPDVEAFADDLRRYLRGLAVAAAPDNALQRMARWLGRHRLAALATLIVLLVIAVTGAITVGSLVHESRVVRAVHERERSLERFLAGAIEDAYALDLELNRHETALERLAGAAEAELTSSAAPASPADRLVAPLLRRALEAPKDAGASGWLPAERAYVTLATGEHHEQPAAKAPAGDPRLWPSYRSAAGAEVPRWVARATAERGSVLGCAVALRDDAGQVIGVAGIELSEKEIERRFLAPSADRRWATAWIVEPSGAALAHGGAGDGSTLEPAVASALARGARGLVELGGEAAGIAPLTSAGWVFVAVSNP